MTQADQSGAKVLQTPFARLPTSAAGAMETGGANLSPHSLASSLLPQVGSENPLSSVTSGLLALANGQQQKPPKNSHAKEELKQGGQVIAANAKGNAKGSGSGSEIDWTDGPDPDMSLARASEEEGGYNIQSIVDPTTGNVIITSNNIRMEVAPLSAEFDQMFAGKSDAEIQQMIDGWQAQKNADDGLAYSNVERTDGGNVTGTADLRQLAHDQGYYGSEQHMVWATAASARTGGRIPPEFFLDFDPFGGTAGNGPNIEQGGNSGEPLSTISMAHDTDWSLGRYMNVGPLSGLHGIEATEQYQMKRMGMAGLFNGSEALALNPAGIVNPFSEEDRQRGATDDQIFRVLNAAAEPDVLYRGFSRNLLGDENYKLNANLPDWSVQYSPDYLRNVRGPTDDHTEFSEAEIFRGEGVRGNAVGWLNERHAPGR